VVARRGGRKRRERRPQTSSLHQPQAQAASSPPLSPLLTSLPPHTHAMVLAAPRVCASPCRFGMEPTDHGNGAHRVGAAPVELRVHASPCSPR
jgi:hypothetical protein